MYRSRGRSIAKLTTNLPRLLEAAGLLKKAMPEPQPKDDRPSPTGSMIQNMMSSFHSNKEDEKTYSRAASKRGTVNVPSFMDPAAWPQGDVLIQVGHTYTCWELILCPQVLTLGTKTSSFIAGMLTNCRPDHQVFSCLLVHHGASCYKHVAETTEPDC
jgi:hypothetical protein